jgi:hypothetical protein
MYRLIKPKIKPPLPKQEKSKDPVDYESKYEIHERAQCPAAHKTIQTPAKIRAKHDKQLSDAQYLLPGIKIDLLRAAFICWRNQNELRVQSNHQAGIKLKHYTKIIAVNAW